MKIGLVFPYNIAKGGGVLEIVVAMQAELAKRGHTAKILTPEPRDLTDMPDFQRKDHIIFVGSGADFKSPLHTTAQFSMAADTNGITQMLEEEKFDLLHFHEPWVPMLSQQILSRSTSVNVATFHAKLPETVMSRTLSKVVTPYTKMVLKQLDELTAVSEAASEYVRSLTDEPVSIIPNGIDLSKYKVMKQSGVNPGKTILYIGRLEKRKGVNYLLHAYSLLVTKNPDVNLIIAGDGPDRETLEYLASDLNLGNVTFTGYVTDEEKLELLQEADVFCAPALYGESFGIVLLEAMATGLVTVAGNNPGYASVMQDIGSLSLVNPKDSEELCRRLDVMLHDENLRKLWKKWAAEQIPQYDYPRIVDQYLEIYESAYKRHSESAEPVWAN